VCEANEVREERIVMGTDMTKGSDGWANTVLTSLSLHVDLFYVFIFSLVHYKKLKNTGKFNQ